MEDDNIYHVRIAFGDPGPQEKAVILTVEFENWEDATAVDRQDFAMSVFNTIVDAMSANNGDN